MVHQINRIELRPGYEISRIIKGGWQLAGGHGKIDKKQAIEDMREFVAADITTFDCADIYTGVEALIGDFLRAEQDAFANGSLPPVQVHTKYVPNYDILPTLTKADTERAINRSLRRLGVERLDLVQFHWWNYGIPGYVETALHLARLQEKGKIRYLGVTNFDTEHLQKILDAGVDIVANQVQYSVLDHRPQAAMVNLARKNNFQLLCYGVIAGGFLSDRYLSTTELSLSHANRSLTKYRLIINEFGGYAPYQQLLVTLRDIATKYSVGIAEIAAKYILQKPKVAALIIGARNQNHLSSWLQLDNFQLSESDVDAITSMVARSSGPSGPVYDLERDRTGPHGRIMKYNLNS